MAKQAQDSYINQSKETVHYMKRKVIFFIAFLMLGTMLGMQFRSTTYTNRQKAATKYTLEQRKKELADEINNSNALKARIDEEEKRKQEYLDMLADIDSKNEVDGLMSQLDSLKLKAGLTDVKGPGITVKLNDAPSGKNGFSSALIIHDNDIFAVLNELRAAGAQAISINDERIIATSEQVCAGPTIRINKNRYTVPFVIKAIGNADNLEKSLSKSEIVGSLLHDGIKVSIEKQKEVLIYGYKNSIDDLMTGLEVK